MFAFLKKLFGKSEKTEVKVNPVIARAEAAKAEAKPAASKPKSTAKKAAVVAKTARNKKPKAKA